METVYRLILPKWAQTPSSRRVYEGQFTWEQIEALNLKLYNCYYLPNHPSRYEPGKTVDGSDIDVFNYVFVDCDLKDGTYATKEAFINALSAVSLPPSRVVDSGNGVHAYWRLSDLDAIAYLRLQRRLCRLLRTDEAVGQIYQLMRVPGTVNTKHEDAFKLCEELSSSDVVYTCEQLDKALPPITLEDEEYCQVHYAKTYKLGGEQVQVDDKLPLKFAKLLRSSPEVKAIWSGDVDDRSKGDYRLGHILLANGFTRAEAMSVLVNTGKALQRAPVHRVSYAENIVDKIWTFEEPGPRQLPDSAAPGDDWDLSSSVRDILSRTPGDAVLGRRFSCWKWLDNTVKGFRLGQVIGLVAGAKVGKTAIALNMFEGFAGNNPDYVHFFISLEQPKGEIADRWRVLCGGNEALYDKVRIVDNHNADGTFRRLSLEDLQDFILQFQERTGKKAGCVVIDHIGILKKSSKDGRQSIEDICHEMKAFALATNTLLVMQSQAPREKAGEGDLELNKDAAYGTVFFESYVDFLITLWQPLKRMHTREGCPTVTVIKFCAMRHKLPKQDGIQEGLCYRFYFDSNTGRLREMTQDEETAFDYWNKQCVNKRRADRKTDIGSYVSAKWTEGAAGNDKNTGAA